MNPVEVEGSSIDEAIELALQRLGATREQVEVDILASPTRGVLGIGSRKAKVRVRVRQPLTVEAGSADDPLPEPLRAPLTVAPDPALAGRAQTLLHDILDHMGFQVSVVATEHPGVIELSITGDSTGVLIGRHGQTLDAIEYFVQRALGRDDAGTRISIDCEQYRVRRREMLESAAMRLAQEAKNKRKSMTMEALSPRDRRIVHLALQDQAGVTTRSSGEGHHRDLMIIPEGARAPRGSAGGRRDLRPPRNDNRSDQR